jgi:ankyrin repeat protein
MFIQWPLEDYWRRLVNRLLISWIDLRRRQQRRLGRQRFKASYIENRPQATFTRAISSGHLHNIEMLLRRGADPNGVLADGTPYLIGAIRTRRRNVAQMLLASGANPDARDPASGDTALMSAILQRDAVIAELLLDAGVDVEACGISGISPIQAAAYVGNAKLVHLLLTKNADAQRSNIHGWSAASIADSKGIEDVKQIIAGGSTDH